MNDYELHPCFNSGNNCMCCTTARLHLAVATKCNIKCKYCKINYNSNQFIPGNCKKVLEVKNVIEYINEYYKKYGPDLKIIGVSGPGEPLYNSETFSSIGLVKSSFPNIKTCICSNGLLVEDYIDDIKKLDLDYFSLTINTLTPSIGVEIYDYAYYNNVLYTGIRASELLIEKQIKAVKILSGIDSIKVKINTVLIPGVNDRCVFEIANLAKENGVSIMNIIPLIPQGHFIDKIHPDRENLIKLKNKLNKVVRQKYNCMQCSADMAGY